MKTIVVATKNKGKLKEIKEIFKDIPYNFVSMEDMGIDVEIDEDADTFLGNATKKATEIMKLCGEITMADDSGLCVDYLDGAPGIYSARFANIEVHNGVNVDNEKKADDEENNNLLLKKLEGVDESERTAYYVCAICCIFPDGKEITVRGECHGTIGFERDGNAGFGYDPLFIINGKSFGKYEGEEKDKISHRGNALRKLTKALENIL